MNSPPNILLIDNQFLSLQEVALYQSLLPNNWTPAPSPQNIKYFSKDLYQHYKWDHNWDSARWLDSVSIEWENLYNKISMLLPLHYVHWVDLKITPPLSTGTPLHRDKDPHSPGGDAQKFSRSISVICNLNHQWSPDWGGDFILWTEDNGNLQEHTRIPINPGQLVIVENCYHSVAPVVEHNQCRISFILHVLEYR
jgi:hypothetical protein